jgi:hypothetical protein
VIHRTQRAKGKLKVDRDDEVVSQCEESLYDIATAPVNPNLANQMYSIVWFLLSIWVSADAANGDLLKYKVSSDCQHNSGNIPRSSILP